jgi:hypothetical protein
VVRGRRERGVEGPPQRWRMARERERGCVGSWRTDQLFAKELGKSGVLKSGVLITRKKRRGRQRWCKQGKSYGRNMYNGIME